MNKSQFVFALFTQRQQGLGWREWLLLILLLGAFILFQFGISLLLNRLFRGGWRQIGEGYAKANRLDRDPSPPAASRDDGSAHRP